MEEIARVVSEVSGRGSVRAEVLSEDEFQAQRQWNPPVVSQGWGRDGWLDV
jgi:hypothetical protein